MSKYPEIDNKRARLYSIKDRFSKVQLDFLGKPVSADASMQDWWDALPDILIAKDLKALIADIVDSRKRQKPVILMMGAHVIKVGLSPILIDLMDQGIITALAMNGAGIIHDTELSMFGMTSEDVASNLFDGSFGMVKETGDFINGAIDAGVKEKLGLGETIGKALVEAKAKNLDISLLGQAYLKDVPVTVHVGIGTDIIHQQPSTDGAAIGELSYRDFKILAQHITGLDNGGVVLNVGSAVVLPEVFLKALTVARNLGDPCKKFTTANFDMIQHYRPRVNVVTRPTMGGGQGYTFTGHHEIMIPLLAAGIKMGMKI
ncbi:hypothetical protein KKA00_03655 [bacterium]|nr:hypothetical protein [bacterium]MBU1651289.1 hypothetical protein [bacterium]MBU1880470.1 hypothetical protein [bacterium]